MKAISLTGTAIVLVSLPSFAADHGKRPVKPRAMHTTHVRHHHEVAPRIDPMEKVEKVEKADKAVKLPPARPCQNEPISIARGTEEERVSLTRCDGTATQEGVDHLSVLARADSVHRPAAHGAMPAGMRRVDARLVERLQQVADHFGRGNGRRPVSIHIVSGFRPNSAGSFHATAQAIDFRVDNVRNEELVAFCKTMPDTGCGYYPNSSFVHLDVRAPGTGHVAWIDASGPGESPHYVASWPPPPPAGSEDFVAKLEKILPPLPIDEHPADVRNAIEAGEAMGAVGVLKRVH